MKRQSLGAMALLCLALSGFDLPAHAQAHVLNFGTSPAEPLVACATASGVCGNFSRLLQSYGDIPGVIDVSTRSWDGGALSWWPSNYNGLYGVAFNNAASNVAPAWVDLVPLGGQAVTLTHFDLGGHLGQRHNVAVHVFDLGSGAALFSYLGDIGTRGTNVGGDWGQHSGFDLQLSSTSGLRIQWADPSVAANTAIDNIHFSVAAPVPEPAPGALLALGLTGLALRRRGKRLRGGGAT